MLGSCLLYPPPSSCPGPLPSQVGGRGPGRQGGAERQRVGGAAPHQGGRHACQLVVTVQRCAAGQRVLKFLEQRQACSRGAGPAQTRPQAERPGQRQEGRQAGILLHCQRAWGRGAACRMTHQCQRAGPEKKAWGLRSRSLGNRHKEVADRAHGLAPRRRSAEQQGPMRAELLRASVRRCQRGAAARPSPVLPSPLVVSLPVLSVPGVAGSPRACASCTGRQT